MATQINAQQIINGTFGRVMINNKLFANAKSFEVKITPSYEEFSIAGKLGTYQKYMGYSVGGTIKFDKVDFELAKKVSKGFLNGILEAFTIIGEVYDPSAQGSSIISISGVTFDEVTLMSFENRKMMEEEFSFKAVEVSYQESYKEEKDAIIT